MAVSYSVSKAVSYSVSKGKGMSLDYLNVVVVRVICILYIILRIQLKYIRTHGGCFCVCICKCVCD